MHVEVNIAIIKVTSFMPECALAAILLKSVLNICKRPVAIV